MSRSICICKYTPKYVCMYYIDIIYEYKYTDICLYLVKHIYVYLYS